MLLRGSLGVGGGWIAHELFWSFWGVLQLAWTERVAGDDRPTWRLRLRTRLLDGFSGSGGQVSALAACLPYSALGGVVAGEGRRRHLELAAAVDFHDGNIGSMVRLMAVAARAHAADARYLLAHSKRLTAAGLVLVIDAAAEPPAPFLNAGDAGCRQAFALPPARRGRSREIALWVDELERRGEARAEETPWGITAKYSIGWTAETQSILELRPDASRPLLGPGVTIGLWTPVRGGPMDAMAWNAREVGAASRGEALGGWWAPPGGVLVHRAFFPAEICKPDVVAAVLDACTRRARYSASVVAARE